MSARFMWQSSVYYSQWQTLCKTLKRSELLLEVSCKKPELHYVAELSRPCTMFTVMFGELPSVGLYTIKQHGCTGLLC